MASSTPVWTDSINVIAAQVLARGSTLRGTIDIRAKWAARLFIRCGRGGATGISASGLIFILRPVINNGSGVVATHPFYFQTPSPGTAAAGNTTVGTNSNSGQPALNVASAASFAADDLICVQDSGGGVTRLEFHRLSKVAAGVLTCDRNLQENHTAAQADTVRNKADILAPIFIPGGSLYEVIVDYGPASTGESVTVEVKAQSLDSVTTA